MATDELQELAHRHLLMHFTRNGAFGPGGNRLLVLERGEGPYVFDTDGKRYLDGLSARCSAARSATRYGEEMAVGRRRAAARRCSFATNGAWRTRPRWRWPDAGGRARPG